MKKGLWGVVFFIAVFLIVRSRYEVPVLMYHHVGNSEAPPSLNVSTKTFERQMEFLKAHWYRVIPLPELVEKLKSNQKLPPKTVVIAFDDGYLDNFTNAFPILKKMGFPATIFVISGSIGQEGFLSEEDLKILDSSGITIGSHTVHHAFLPKLSHEEIVFELKESKSALEKVLGHPVIFFSYPAGGVTEEAKSLVERAGYEGAVTTNYGHKKDDVFALRRVKISDAHGSLFNFWAKVSGFYLFGKKKTCLEKNKFVHYYEGKGSG